MKGPSLVPAVGPARSPVRPRSGIVAGVLGQSSFDDTNERIGQVRPRVAKRLRRTMPGRVDCPIAVRVSPSNGCAPVTRKYRSTPML